MNSGITLSIPFWSDFNLNVCDFCDDLVLLFQSHFGLISTYIMNAADFEPGPLSIPFWSDFNPEGGGRSRLGWKTFNPILV